VYIYSNKTGPWEQIQRVFGSSSDKFGWSLALNRNGTRLLVGRPYSTRGGRASLFRRYTNVFNNTINITDLDSWQPSNGYATSLDMAWDGNTGETPNKPKGDPALRAPLAVQSCALLNNVVGGGTP
jgi:hypothetical protein